MALSRKFSAGQASSAKSSGAFPGASDDLLATATKSAGRIENIELSKISVGDNPRQTFAEIEDLAATIAEVGLLEPIVVLAPRKGVYRLVAGERRIRAFKHLGRKEIPAVVKRVDELSDDDLAVARVIENIQRDDLRPHEIAIYVAKLVQEGGMTQADVSRKLGKSKPWVTFRVAHAGLIQEDRRAARLDSQAAYKIAQIQDPAERRALLDEIGRAGKETRESVARLVEAKKDRTKKGGSAKAQDELLVAIERLEKRMRRELSNASANQRAGYVKALRKLANDINAGRL